VTRFPLEPTPIHISDEVLDDLRARLALTRAPLGEGNGDWFYGVPDSYLRGLVAYWRDGYGWREAEAAINAYEHYQVSVAGVPVHLVNFWKVADLWHTLMTEIWDGRGTPPGAVTSADSSPASSGTKYAEELYGIHIGSGLPLDFFNGPRAWDFARNRPLSDDQPADVRARIIELDHRSASHLAVHMLDGATLAHGLSDSPAGLLAWLLERWNAWSGNGGDLESVFTKDDLLTHATIYWVNNSIVTSMRYYANANRYHWAPVHDRAPVVQAPVGLSFVTYENRPASTPPTSASARSRPARRPSGSTTSMSTPTTTAATSSPGRIPTPGSATCAAPSTAADPHSQITNHWTGTTVRSRCSAQTPDDEREPAMSGNSPRPQDDSRHNGGRSVSRETLGITY
jgi:hypothetical protein